MADSRDRGTVEREACKQAAHTLDRMLHGSREKSLALTKLEEAMFWANASIARVCDAGVE